MLWHQDRKVLGKSEVQHHDSSQVQPSENDTTQEGRNWHIFVLLYMRLMVSGLGRERLLSIIK